MVKNLNLMKLMEYVSHNNEIRRKFESFTTNATAAIKHFIIFKAAKSGKRPAEINKDDMKISADISIGSLWDCVEKDMRKVAADLDDLNRMTHGTVINGSVEKNNFSNLIECVCKVENFLWNTRRIQLENYGVA